jgi:hypothetical protein
VSGLEVKFAPQIADTLAVLDDSQIMLLRCHAGFVIDWHPNSVLYAVAEQFERLGLASLDARRGMELHYSLTDQGAAMAALVADFLAVPA